MNNNSENAQTNRTVYIFTTYFENDNYGGLLQAYALQRYLKKEGYTAIDVSYRTEYNDVISKKYSRLEKIKMNFSGTDIKEKVQISLKLARRILLKSLLGRNVQKKIIIRKRYFSDFREMQITHTEQVYSDSNLTELPSEVYAYITGSDLVWLLGNKNELPKGYWLLPFRGKKISYAASIPMKELNIVQAERISEALADYTAVSVREYAGKELLEKYVTYDKPIYQVVDPVFLLSKNEWITDLDLKRLETSEYICTYFLGESQKNRKFAKYISHRINKPIINIAHVLRFCDNDIMFGSAKIDVSVSEFVNYIKDASIVITDSFHGAAFSEIFGVPYIVTERFEGSKKNNLNERLFTLLKNTGKDAFYFSGSLKEMKNRFNSINNLKSGDSISTFAEKIKKSKDYLIAALEK